jgi:hypothetical protein
MYEFPDVRRVAAEGLGRLPPRVALACMGAPFPAVASKDVRSFAVALDDFLLGRSVVDREAVVSGSEPAVELLPAVQRSKALVYALCHAMVNHSDDLASSRTANSSAITSLSAGEGGNAEDNAAWWTNAMARLFATLLVPCERPGEASGDGDDDELFKLQRGCIDALSFLLDVPFAKFEADHGHDLPLTPRLIEELPETGDATGGPAAVQGQDAGNTYAAASLGPARDVLRKLMSTGVLPSPLHAAIASITSAPRRRGCVAPPFMSFPEMPCMDEAAAAASVNVPNASQPLAPGTRVELRGLQSRPDLNGVAGVVTCLAPEPSTVGVERLDPALGARYGVRLDKAPGEKTRAALNVKRSNLVVLSSSVLREGAAKSDGTSAPGIRALRIIAANAHIAAMQRCDPRNTLPLVLRDSFPSLLATARGHTREGSTALPGASGALRAAALQALFVGAYRLTYGPPDASAACQELVHATPFVADTLAAALAALAPAPATPETLIREVKTMASAPDLPGATPAQDDGVEMAALKVLMALAAKVPNLFAATPFQAGDRASLGGRSASLVKAMTLPASAGVLGTTSLSEGAAEGAGAGAAVKEFPRLDGPSALASLRSTVGGLASGRSGTGSAAVRRLAAQLLGAVGV